MSHDNAARLGNADAAGAAPAPKRRLQSVLHTLLADEGEIGGVSITFHAFDPNLPQPQPMATVTATITMDFGSTIESQLHGIWTDTSFELQLLLYASADHPIGFTFKRLGG
jgi:hypothetical protein